MSTDTKFPYYNPEVWGGIECTINRVDNVYRDQLSYAGHYGRKNDIEKIAELGITTLRYPVLWEKCHPTKYGKPDWTWIREQLHSIRQHNITPVAGLLHHGSGPAYTDLLDKNFPAHLAAYASKVATEFPWLEYYTPVNEPLTTARFSGLYGFWYPHHKNESSFLRMLVNQVKGIILSMQAIRKINPAAKLIQTEDLSKTHSTPVLQYQAEFENTRRWLTWDLLCGMITEKHFFWNYFITHGISKDDLNFFLDNPCPPDIMGFNYYVTSERWIDEHLDAYPVSTHGGNGQHAYADTEAVRHSQTAGLSVLIKEAWSRYKLPIAITESHLNCTREEQLRWLKETWDTCCNLKKDGIEIKAVTAWALLGAFDWNSMLTKEKNHYEPGVYDISNNNLRATSLKKMIISLASGEKYEHPVIRQKGWWHSDQQHAHDYTSLISNKVAPLMILGKTGTLGAAFMRICERRRIPYVALSRNDIDILEEQDIIRVIEKYRPWAIVNAAGYVKVDEAEEHSHECFAINATAPGLLARCCKASGIQFMTFSSDLVFDGEKNMPYHETDRVLPLNIYGQSKAQGENLSLVTFPDSLIIRSSAFFGPWDKHNFAYDVLKALENNQTFYTVHDVMISPTYVPDLADAALDLLIDEEKGIWHLSNEGVLTWSDFAASVAERTNFKKTALVAKSLNEMAWKAQRPRYSVLESGKGIKLPALTNALDRFFEHRLV